MKSFINKVFSISLLSGVIYFCSFWIFSIGLSNTLKFIIPQIYSFLEVLFFSGIFLVAIYFLAALLLLMEMFCFSSSGSGKILRFFRWVLRACIFLLIFIRPGNHIYIFSFLGAGFLVSIAVILFRSPKPSINAILKENKLLPYILSFSLIMSPVFAYKMATDLPARFAFPLSLLKGENTEKLKYVDYFGGKFILLSSNGKEIYFVDEVRVKAN